MLLIYDTETNTLIDWTLPADDPKQARCAELGMLLVDENGKEIERFSSLVKPDGWTMAPGASAVNKLTDEILTAEGRPIKEVIDRFDDFASKASLVICYNVRWDEKIARGERRRLGRPDGFGTIPVFCCIRGATPLCKIKPTKKMRDVKFFDYKTPKLSEAVKILLGREHVGAHGALADALATKDLYFAFRDNHEFMAAGSAFKTNEAKGATPIQDDPRNHVALGPPIAPGPGVSNTRVGGSLPEPLLTPCKWCGTPTPMNTKMCDRCWELDHRIGGDIVLAERILQHYKSPKQTKPMEPPAVGVKTEPLATGAGAQPAGDQPQDGSTPLDDLFKLY